jgi:hypothetical protein
VDAPVGRPRATREFGMAGSTGFGTRSLAVSVLNAGGGKGVPRGVRTTENLLRGEYWVPTDSIDELLPHRWTQAAVAG